MHFYTSFENVPFSIRLTAQVREALPVVLQPQSAIGSAPNLFGKDKSHASIRCITRNATWRTFLNKSNGYVIFQ